MKMLLTKLTAPKNTSGQDLFEYALMAGFIAVTASAILPGLASSISTIFSQVASALPADATPLSAATN
jgi:Flp pilus assembly pilin Flp